jgi:hypothetical protein
MSFSVINVNRLWRKQLLKLHPELPKTELNLELKKLQRSPSFLSVLHRHLKHAMNLKSLGLDPETTILSSTHDGVVFNNNADWAACRNATSGSGYMASTETKDEQAMRAYYGYAGTKFAIYRSFFYFDTSPLGASAILSAVDLLIYGYTNKQSSVCAMKGTQADPYGFDDYDAFSGSEYGHVAWAINQYNTISFNAAGIADINKTGVTKICCREYDHDYLDVSPGTSSYSNGCYFADYGADRAPKLVVTYALPAGNPLIGKPLISSMKIKKSLFRV